MFSLFAPTDLQKPAPESTDIGKIIDSIGYTFIAMGTVTGIISFLGCCGGLCNSRTLLVWVCVHGLKTMNLVLCF